MTPYVSCRCSSPITAGQIYDRDLPWVKSARIGLEGSRAATGLTQDVSCVKGQEACGAMGKVAKTRVEFTTRALVAGGQGVAGSNPASPTRLLVEVERLRWSATIYVDCWLTGLLSGLRKRDGSNCSS